MNEESPTRVIYIGGIPFDQTEEQVLEIARTVGPVDQIQLIFDRETGKSKGYAFVKYPDIQTAMSAVRNLNKYTIGTRTLKCNFAKEELILDPFGVNSGNNNGLGASSRSLNKKQSIPPLPPGVDVYNELPGDYITRELQRMDRSRMAKILGDSIKMSKTNPSLMEELLEKCPQLSYAIVQLSLILNAINEKDLASLVKQIPDSLVDPSSSGVSALVSVENLTEEQRGLIRQVVLLSEKEIGTLSDDQKKAVYLLKGQYLGLV